MFNTEKLDWFNQQHIMRLAPDELAVRVKPWLETAGLWRDDYLDDRHAWFFAVLELLRPRAKRLGRLRRARRASFSRYGRVRRLCGRKVPARAEASTRISQRSSSTFAALDSFDAASTELALRSLAEARGVKAAVLIHAVRVAVTGKAASPGLFDVLALLGRNRVRGTARGRAPLLMTSRS